MIDENDIAAVAQALSEGEALAGLRRRFPALSFARCDSVDVEETPFRILEGVDLHLMDARDHCVKITADLAAASGLLIARHGPRA